MTDDQRPQTEPSAAAAAQRPAGSQAEQPWWSRPTSSDPWAPARGPSYAPPAGASGSFATFNPQQPGQPYPGQSGVPGPAGPQQTGPLPPYPTQPMPGASGPRRGDPDSGQAYDPGHRADRSRGRAGVIAGGLVLALLAGGVGGGVGYLLADTNEPGTTTNLTTSPTTQIQRPPDSIAGIAEQVLPSVVSVESGPSTGSGFVIDGENGYILTNNHVIENAAGGVPLQVTTQEGRVLPAEIEGRTESYDLAVLKVDATDLQAATLGNSEDLRVGDPVVAVGSPLGLTGTVTSGIVSALDRPVTAGSQQQGLESFVSAIQTDAAINPGNSGGPLVDGAGRVIGVNSSIATLSQQSGSIGLGFAIPMDKARRVAEQLIDSGVATYPIIGVRPAAVETGAGVGIAAVTPDSPAEAAGLQVGDIITAVEGEPVTDPTELIVAVRSREPGDQVTVQYDRGGQRAEATVTLGAEQEQL